MSLTAVLLTFLFSFFVESAKIEKKLDTARMTITSRSYLQTRLQTVLSTVDHSDSSFYTKQFEKEKHNSLVLLFDNGIDPDPIFSGLVMGRLYLDEKKNLSLAIWPLDKNKNRPWRKEVLMPNVENFEFEFLGARTATEHGKKEKIRPINATYAWRELWPKSLGGTPSIIRLTVHQKEPLHFAFILPSPEPLVTYFGGKVI